MADQHRRIVIDTETTGLDRRPPKRGGDEILSIGIVDLETDEVLLDEMFRPRYHTEWPGAQRVNHISPASVSASLPVSACADEIREIIDAASDIYIYNAEFDAAMLRGAGINLRGKRVHDVMLDFAETARIGKHRNGGWRWVKLADAVRMTGSTWSGTPHGAVADALATAAVQRAMEDGWGGKKKKGRNWNNMMLYLEDNLKEQFTTAAADNMPWYKRWYVWVVVMLVLCIIGMCD